MIIRSSHRSYFAWNQLDFSIMWGKKKIPVAAKCGFLTCMKHVSGWGTISERQHDLVIQKAGVQDELESTKSRHSYQNIGPHSLKQTQNSLLTWRRVHFSSLTQQKLPEIKLSRNSHNALNLMVNSKSTKYFGYMERLPSLKDSFDPRSPACAHGKA